ncbi:MAG TPA: lipopolysaccharide heptosyltransferase II [Verrucomicrobiae bacterium]|nr:lipopolysaccharide heptosyltransferase II [Verrucomicrobiae bacterium]
MGDSQMPARHPERILVRGVNWLGDAVMTTPALQRLREARPEAHLTLLTHQKLEAIWQSCPSLDALLTFGPDDSAWKIGRRLRRENFDIGLVLPNSPRSALELWLAGVPQRIGYARPWRNWLLTRRVQARPEAVEMRKRSAAEINRLIQSGPGLSVAPPPIGAHHIFQYLHLAAALGARPEPLAPRLVISEGEIAQVAAKFKLGDQSASAAPWFGLSAGAEYGPAKRWPEESFTEAAIAVQRRTRCRWLVFGVRADAEPAMRITTNICRAAEQEVGRETAVLGPAAMNLAEQTSLGELCAALKHCRVLLTNDSGSMHLAAALGVPVVVPFGSTSPELTGPGLPDDPRHHLLKSNAACSPCFLRECPIDFRCMKGIGVEAVTREVLEAAGEQIPVSKFMHFDDPKGGS